MRYPRTIFLVVLAGLMGLTGCHSTPATHDSQQGQSTALSRGAELYSRHCQRCHLPRNPVEYDDRHWGVVMQHMQVRANLTREQARRVRTFLVATNEPGDRARRRADPPANADTGPAEVSAEMMRAGRGVYGGQGTCAACHGASLEGGPLAPNLRDEQWNRGDGSYESILQVIQDGVPGTTMNAYPGGITNEQAKQVAAYVWGVSQGELEP